MWLIRFALRYLLPMFFQQLVNKAHNRVNQQYQQQQQGSANHRPRRPAGELHVDYIPPKDKEARAADKAGEFVDFEEIK